MRRTKADRRALAAARPQLMTLIGPGHSAWSWGTGQLPACVAGLGFCLVPPPGASGLRVREIADHLEARGAIVTYGRDERSKFDAVDDLVKGRG